MDSIPTTKDSDSLKSGEFNASNVGELSAELNITTTTLFWLTIATGGIYIILYIDRAIAVLNKNAGTELLSKKIVLYLAICFGLSSIFTSAGKESTIDSLALVGSLLYLSYNVLVIVWAFKAGKVLQDLCLSRYSLDLKMNGFYTFLFNALYVNYCINDLRAAKNRQDLIMKRFTQENKR